MTRAVRWLMLLAWLAEIPITGWASPPPEAAFHDAFEKAETERWFVDGGLGDWKVRGGLLRRHGTGDSTWRAKLPPVQDLMVERVRLIAGGRKTFGIAVRVTEEANLLVRYYDVPQALEVLSYRKAAWQQLGGRSEKIAVPQGGWHRLKIAAVGDSLSAKLWPDHDPEPDWQLAVTVDRLDPGTFSLVAHDDTPVQFDWVRSWTDAPDLVAIRDRRHAERKAQREKLASGLQLAVVPTAHDEVSSAGPVRKMHLVTFAGTDRVPMPGALTVQSADYEVKTRVDESDFVLGAHVFDVPAPSELTTYKIQFQTDLKTLDAQVELEPVTPLSWRRYVTNCLDTLIAHGRDDYGIQTSPLFMAVLDADTLRSPSRPYPLDGPIRLEGRMHRRGERGCNLWYDQTLLKALYRVGDLTDDPKYQQAGDDYIKYFFENCRKINDPEHVFLNGMPAWGTHVFWDCFRDRPAGDGDGNGPHEILLFRAEWESMFRVHPAGVKRTVDGVWLHHIVDKMSGLHNRHDDGRQGCDFAFSGSSFAHAFAFLYHQTRDASYLEKAKTVAGWHWNHRNEATGLTADCPGLPRRYDGNHIFTTVVGPHATALLECYQLTGDPYFRDVAVAYIKSYDRYGWDESAQTYWAMLRLDGSPVPDQEKGAGYDAYAPYGHVNVWRTTFFSYEFTLSAAQAAVQAYEISLRDGDGDPELLTIAKRWASVVERSLPAHTGRRWKDELEEVLPRAAKTGGAYAEDYGRAISLFVHMYRAAKDAHYLELAEELAGDAVRKLYHNGLFLGHSAKPYYESTSGVGLLLVALLELDDPTTDLGGAL